MEKTKEQVWSRPAQGDPEDSIECLRCRNDIYDAVNEHYKYCPHCGQKIQA